MDDVSVSDAGMYARESPYLDCYVQIGVASGKVLRVTFPTSPDPDATADHAVLDRLFEYLDGVDPVTFDDVDIALTVPTAHRRVLETLRTVPYGESVSVETLTRMTGDLDPGADADRSVVRTALDENPAPIVLPDHRVRDGPSAAPPDVEQKLRSLEGL